MSTLLKNLANIITSLRFVCAVAMVLVAPFSALFWGCYLLGGVSDIVDGAVARKYHQQSKTGALLDSIADLTFALAIFIVVAVNIHLPLWLWLCIAFIAAMRLTGYAIGFYKYRVFSSLHTHLNKATGALIFAFPLLHTFLGLTAAGIVVCLVAFFSSLEELAITIKSRSINRDCKGFLFCSIK